MIQNGTDGTIITENYAEGNTTVQVSHDFTNETTYPKGTYKVELYLTDTATKPVATGNLVIAERPLKLVFFHDDHLGTPRLITDEDGQTVSTHDYLAYGEELTDPEFTTNNMKFTGHERDPETGLDYMLARYYTAGSGRFLQVDPGYDYDPMDPMSFNLYGYVRGNPVMGTDPTGERIDVDLDKKTNTYNITIHASLVNKSSKTYSEKELKAAADKYAAAVKKSMSGSATGSDSKTYTWNTTVKWTSVGDEKAAASDDHMVYLADTKEKSTVLGETSSMGGMVVLLKPSASADTLAHEFGHTMNLFHNSAGNDENNFMNQGHVDNPRSSLKQINMIYRFSKVGQGYLINRNDKKNFWSELVYDYKVKGISWKSWRKK